MLHFSVHIPTANDITGHCFNTALDSWKDNASAPALPLHPALPQPTTSITNMSSSQPPSSVDSTDTPYRYAAYAQRVRTLLLSAHRYVAYTSDIGESFRPVAHPWLVRSAYGISWAYLVGDVGHEGYKAYLRNRRALAPPGDAHKDATSEQILVGMATGNISLPLTSEGRAKEKDSLTPWPTTEISLAEDYRMVMAKRAVFQSIASMGLPAFTIHSVVKYSGRAVKGAKSTLLRTWLPIGVCIRHFLCPRLVGVGSPTLGELLLIIFFRSPARSLRRPLPPIPLRPPCRRSR